MPFRELTKISLEERERMTAVFDAVCARLELSIEDPRRAKVASKIIALTEAGERDPGKLTEETLLGL